MRANYTLPRLYLDAELYGDIELSKDHSRYIATVLRKSAGDELRLFNARDGEWAAIITAVEKRSVTVRVDRALRAPYAPPDIRLLFAPVRKHRTATILEKSAELGVRTLQPVITERTQFPKLNLERGRAQLVEASEQTERLDIPVLHAPVPLSDALDPHRTLVFADETGGGASLLTLSLQTPLDLLIGPEGGFTNRERDMLVSRSHVTTVSLGPRILRADTAAISLLTLVQAHCGDWRHI